MEFYNAADNIFFIRKGETEIRHDHSFSYRHRNKNYYPYQDYTLQELTGLVNILFQSLLIHVLKNTSTKAPTFLPISIWL
jgi:hypothetical protein